MRLKRGGCRNCAVDKGQQNTLSLFEKHILGLWMFCCRFLHASRLYIGFMVGFIRSYHNRGYTDHFRQCFSIHIIVKLPKLSTSVT